MPTTIEATIDRRGNVFLRTPIRFTTPSRAFVIILEEEPVAPIPETALLSELSLAIDWNRPEENEAWAYLSHE
jgi:hypothetical protein